MSVGPVAGKPGELPRTFPAVAGQADSRYADGVEITLSSGARVRPDIVWVSDPIHEGFFYYVAPDGELVHAVTATKNGRPVDADHSGDPSYVAPVPSPFAQLDKRHEEVAVQTRAGRAVIWSAPTKTDEVCSWLELAGDRRAVVPCLPTGYGIDRSAGAAFSYERVAGANLVFGQVGARYGEFRLTLGDGTTTTLETEHGFVLAEVPGAESDVHVQALGPDGEPTGPSIPLQLRGAG